GVPIRYIEPRPSGEFPFEEGVFDLISCLGVLHHIPNVSKIVHEISRCLTPGGHALIREATISMGDWRESRPGLTTRERGIPLDLLRGIIEAAGLEVTFEKRCMFQLTYNLAPFFHNAVWNSRPALLLDRVFCSIFASNPHYHPWNRLQTLRPIAVYYVLRTPPKPADLSCASAVKSIRRRPSPRQARRCPLARTPLLPSPAVPSLHLLQAARRPRGHTP